MSLRRKHDLCTKHEAARLICDPRKLQTDELATIQADDGSTPIKLAKSTLCEASGYFQKALEGGFEEANTKRLTLPDADHKSITLLAYWIYHKKLLDFLQNAAKDDASTRKPRRGASAYPTTTPMPQKSSSSGYGEANFQSSRRS